MSKDGEKVAPMHCQLFNYMHQFPDKMVDTGKLKTKDKMEKLIQDRLPENL